MKILISIKTGLCFMAAILFAACASDDAQHNNDIKQPSTGFTVTFTGNQPGKGGEKETRTKATHTKGGIAKVVWEATDKIFVKATDGTWKQSETAKFITVTSPDSTKANFKLENANYGNSPEVRYTNTGNANTVIIARQQSQPKPGKFNHLGTSGDCGTATSTGSDDNYHFTLNHKAAYLCLYPRFQDAETSVNIRLEKITVTSTSTALAGTFDFTDGKIQDKTPTANSSTQIVLNTNSSPISATTSDDKCFYIVLRPSSSAQTIRVVYTIKDPVTTVSLDISKTITETFAEGKIYDYTAWLDKDIEHIKPVYYMWDAVNSYWNAPNTVQPKVKGATGSGNAQVAGDPYNRWFNTSGAQNTPNTATHSAKNMPNANLMYWYVSRGEPYWDGEKPWTAMGHLYKGVSWYLRKQAIAAKYGHAADPGYLDRLSPDGIDRRVTPPNNMPSGKTYHINNEAAGVIKTGAPSASEISKYFFIPPLGYYNGNKLSYIGEVGTYWSSNSQGVGYHITTGKEGGHYMNRADYCRQDLGFPQWDFK